MMQSVRIRLRALEPEDLEVLYRWENDSSAWKEGSTARPLSRYELRNYIESATDIYTDKQVRLMVELVATGEAIGAVDLFEFDPFHLRASVGILIDPSFRRQGYGREALLLLIEYAFGFLNLHQLNAVVCVDNAPSLSLFCDCAFFESGVMKEWLRVGDEWLDCLLLIRVNPSAEKM